MKLLADTSALLAVVLRDDRHHAVAAKFVRSHSAARFVLTELVLAEVATRLRARAGAERAVAVVRELLRSKRYELVFIDSPVLDGALERMNRFADKRLSFADCASMEPTFRSLGRRDFAIIRHETDGVRISCRASGERQQGRARGERWA